MKYFLLLFLTSFTIIFGVEKKDSPMNEKFLQVEIITEERSKDLEMLVNKFLVLRKIKRQEIFDIKYQRCGLHKSAMIIYEVDLQGDK